MEYREAYLEVASDIKIFYRDVCSDVSDNKSDLPALLCLHGLTRNGEDFCPMIEALAKSEMASEYRFILPDMRGRGASDADPNPDNYSIDTYVKDCWKLLHHLGIHKFSLVGTSMGGVMSMQMIAEQPERVERLLLNDIGPEVPREGLMYILHYLGKDMIEPSWDEALVATKTRLANEYPAISDQEWESIAERTYKRMENGECHLRYDPAIKLPIAEAFERDEKVDLWPLFEAIRCPIFCLRGDRSGILPKSVAEAMQARNPHCNLVEVADRGHVPLLDESVVVDAICTWLAD